MLSWIGQGFGENVTPSLSPPFTLRSNNSYFGGKIVPLIYRENEENNLDGFK